MIVLKKINVHEKCIFKIMGICMRHAWRYDPPVGKGSHAHDDTDCRMHVQLAKSK